MRYWTTQSEVMINSILDEGVYKPNFNLSNGLGSKKMRPSYNEILNEYCKRNKVTCDGLVFGISKLDDKSINSIEDYRLYFSENNTFWDSVSYAGDNYATFEIELPDEIDTIPVYFQDFIILTYRNIRSYEFQEYVKSDLIELEFGDFCDDLKIAQSMGWTDEMLLNKIMQVHSHQISMENIKGIYETVNFGTGLKYSLGDSALKLKRYIK
jgi:hypothetical protein